MNGFNPGDLVTFTDATYSVLWGVGMVLRPDTRRSSLINGRPLYFYVMTHAGEKLIAGCFMNLLKKHTPK
jgi:hypothetical protein